MHKAIRTLLACAGLLAGVASLQAQALLKVIVVDMAKVYDTHYKTEEANAKFNDAAQRAQEQLEKLNQDIQKDVEEYKALVEQTKSPLANDQARAKAGEDAQKKMQDIQNLQNEAQNFRNNTQRSLQQRAKNHRDLIMDEIMKVVNDISRAKGATLVLDKSGPSILGIPVILYSDPSYDITDEVVKEVNKDRPAPAAAPATTGAAAAPAATTPAANNAGGFTVPNVTPQPKKP
ncbi:MAG: OmpH family outer membrane protein [Candidatus Didemnitutus sp.]|nr:OmpH family outer membrane protein [Candidatus Didemnitutus sp.]